MINTIHISRLRNNEFLRFLKDILKLCGRFDVVALAIAERVASLTNLTVSLDEVFNKDQGSEVTHQLDELDDRRDTAISGIKRACEGMSNTIEKPKSDAAKLVLGSIDKHGPGISQLNRPAETQVVDAILADWETDSALAAALVTLDFTTWVNELKESNDLYSSTYQDRVADKISSDGDSFSELRPDAQAAYLHLVKGIVAHSEISDIPEYKELIEAFNVIIEEYNLLIARRQEGNNEEEASDTI